MANKFSAYNPVNDTWTELPDIPFANIDTSPKAVVCNNLIYLFSKNDIYTYNPANKTWGRAMLNAIGSGRQFVVVGTDIFTVFWDASTVAYVINKFIPW